MILIGADPHKPTHTVAAIEAASGELRSSETVAARSSGHAALLDWARALDSERIWAIEDCRHVSGGLERFLVERGERVVRVAPKLMAGARRGARERGKSDPIDATAVARAALREGIETLPQAFLDERSLAIKLLLDHREDLVAESTRVPESAALAPARHRPRARPARALVASPPRAALARCAARSPRPERGGAARPEHRLLGRRGSRRLVHGEGPRSRYRQPPPGGGARC